MTLLPRRALLAVLVALLAVWLVPAQRRPAAPAAQPAVRTQAAAAPAVRPGRPGHGERANGWAGAFALAGSSIFAVALLLAGRAYASGRIGRGFGRELRPTSRGPPLRLAG